jgi:hypothetical protein
MTREKSLAAMDKLVPMGYAVRLYEGNMGDHVQFVDGKMTNISRQLEVTAVSMDQKNLRELVETADGLGLDVVFNPISNTALTLVDKAS